MKLQLDTLPVSAALLCLAIPGCGLLGSKPAMSQKPDDLWTILAAPEAEKMRRPCSRPFPDGLVGSWQPTPADVHAVERVLPAVIDAEFPLLGKRNRPD